MLVMPQVLMALMRHETIETTQRYYVGRNANATADAVWDAYEKAGLGTVLGTVGQKEATDEAVDTGVNPCESSR